MFSAVLIPPDFQQDKNCFPTGCLPQLMKPDTVWGVNLDGLANHQKITLLVIHLEQGHGVGIMIQTYEMLSIWKKPQ